MGNSTTGIVMAVVVTIYGIGITVFWPTMLGVISMRFPKGGAGFVYIFFIAKSDEQPDIQDLNNIKS